MLRIYKLKPKYFLFQLVIVIFGFGPHLHASIVCTPPQTLQFQVRYHPDANAYMELGRWFAEHKQYDCAANAFRKSLQLHPQSSNVSYMLGLSIFLSGNARAAIIPLQQSIQIDSSALRPRLLLAAIYDQLQDQEKAASEYRAALRIDPHSTSALLGLSKILAANNDYLAVIDLLKSVPLDEDLTTGLAQAYSKERMYDQEEQLLVSALKKYPDSMNLTIALINVYMNQTRNQEAAQLAEKLESLHPNNAEAQSLYLHLLILNYDFDKARPIAAKFISEYPHNFEALYLNGVLERLERDAQHYELARRHLEEAVTLNPTHFYARYNLGIVLWEMRDYAEAKIQLEKALSLGAGANEPQVRYRLGNVLRALGKVDEAKEQFKITQTELQEATNKSLAAEKSAEAQNALQSGDMQKAINLYRDALAATPKDALLNFKLAMLLYTAGNSTEEQLSLLQKAVEIDPTFALAQNQLGFLKSDKGDFASAEEHFRLAVQFAPGYAEAWVNLAATLGMESRFEDAQKAVATALKLDPENAKALELEQSLNHDQVQR